MLNIILTREIHLESTDIFILIIIELWLLVIRTDYPIVSVYKLKISLIARDELPISQTCGTMC